MQKQVEGLLQQTFVPIPQFQSITTRQTLGKVQIALLKQPETICGIARRVGYTGKGDEDLAIYRLKIKTERPKIFITLPSVFVVENGIFLNYDAWHSSRHTEI